ncbi:MULTISPECIES: hypothetical protein [unclassified Flavobacterium]|uniref:hypothetical protein n=1 Tax=unclassified Flavobacterium TaxID=196869 RepID=UPI000967A5FD|nr:MULTISPECIES: hypothetical protein [unclassified Flavobacterium]MBN9284297.1 hypothetical protein [Flavobacterium sp.]OJV73004.1 MAG: hypothetical protein BGO42_00770 [Flavobacterium sp. 40-81]
MASKNILKNWFKTGLFPTQSQFWEWMESYWHKDDIIPQAKIQNLKADLDNKAEKASLGIHATDMNAHAELFARVSTPYQFLPVFPTVDTSELQVDALKNTTLNAVMYMGQIDMDVIQLDPITGTLSNWDFRANTQYIILYTKR